VKVDENAWPLPRHVSASVAAQWPFFRGAPKSEEERHEPRT